MGRYFGSGECFMFQVLPELTIYPWVGTTDPARAKSKTTSMFISATAERLGIGGGGNSGT